MEGTLTFSVKISLYPNAVDAVGIQYAVGTQYTVGTQYAVGMQYAVGTQYPVGTQYAVRNTVCSRYAVDSYAVCSRCKCKKVNSHSGLSKYWWWGALTLVQ